MNAYFISLGAGVLVGLVYALLKVRSPAPPAIALIGLLGMLIGEQLLTLAVRQATAAQTTPHDKAAAPGIKALTAPATLGTGPVHAPRQHGQRIYGDGI